MQNWNIISSNVSKECHGDKRNFRTQYHGKAFLTGEIRVRISIKWKYRRLSLGPKAIRKVQTIRT